MTVDRAPGRITTHRIANKTTMTAVVPGRCGSRTVAVPHELVNALRPVGNRAAALCELATRVEEFFCSPQDLEWAFEGNSCGCRRRGPSQPGVDDIAVL